MASIILKDLVKKYDDLEILHGINLTINSGEFIVLVGPSGCGKSTTLRTIVGLESVSSGKIIMDGKEINNTPPHKRDMSLVFQSYALYPHMTVYENMAFALKIKKISKTEIKERIEKTSHDLQIEDLLNRKPRELSGGQQQRVALGRSLVRHPKVFLFDEPLSNLDAKLRVSMRLRISQLHKSMPNTTMIYVTHDQVEAMTMGDKICVMNKGYIEQVGTPQEIYKKPINRFVASFIGSPSMNFIDGKLIKDKDLYFVFGENQLKIDGKFHKILENYNEIELGIRPEDLYIDEKSTILGKVNIIENMGREEYIYMKIGNESITMRDISGRIKVNSTIPIGFNMDKISLFDKESKINILRKGNYE